MNRHAEPDEDDHRDRLPDQCQVEIHRSSPAISRRAGRLLQLPDERVGEGEEERDAHADHRDRVEQRHDDEHLHLQHRGELRLARRAFEEAAAEQAHADADAECAEADEDRDSNRGKSNHSFHRKSPGRKTVSDARAPC